MTSGYYQSEGTQGENITDGIDITNWKVKDPNSGEITFSVWDFAGQTVYYNTHQVRSIISMLFFIMFTVLTFYVLFSIENQI